MADIPQPESRTHSEPPANTEDFPRPRSQQEVPLSPVSLCRASPPLQEPLEFEAPERSRESSYSSNHQRAGGGSRSGSSVSSVSHQSKASKSSRANGSVCSALDSRASSLSQLGSGGQSASGSQRSAAGLVGFQSSISWRDLGYHKRASLEFPWLLSSLSVQCVLRTMLRESYYYLFV